MYAPENRNCAAGTREILCRQKWDKYITVKMIEKQASNLVANFRGS